MYIEYKEIDNSFLEKISVKYGETAKNHIHLENGSFSLAALHDGVPVGFISTYTKMLTPPLQNAKEAYIDIIEVDEPYGNLSIRTRFESVDLEWQESRGRKNL